MRVVSSTIISQAVRVNVTQDREPLPLRILTIE